MGGTVDKAIHVGTLGIIPRGTFDMKAEKPDFSAVSALTRDKPIEDKPLLLQEKRRRNVSRSSGGVKGASGLLASTTSEDA